jgi:hypothetical protein
MLKLIVILALTAFAHCQTGTTASAPAGTTVAAAVGTTAAPSPAGTTAAPSPSPSPAGTTAAPSPSPSPAGTTAAPAPSPTPSSTTGIQYLAAGSTLVYNACSNLIGTATLTNNVCGWFNVTISSNTITINLKTSWTAGALTTAVPVGSTTTGPAATTARPSSASTSVASFLVVALAAVAAALF